MEPVFCKEVKLRGHCFDCPLCFYYRQTISIPKGPYEGPNIHLCTKYKTILDYYDGPLRCNECFKEYGE